MAWRIELSQSAIRALSSLPREEQREIADRIGHLRDGGIPRGIPSSDGLKLVPAGGHLLACMEAPGEHRIVVVTMLPAREPAGRRVRELMGRWIRSVVQGGWMETLWQDVVYSLRSLGKAPGFAMVGLLTLALGIGGVTTIFTLYDQVLLRPLPYPDSRELVVMWERLASFDNASVAYPNFLDWKERNRVFEDVAVWNATTGTLTGFGDPRKVTAARMSASTLPILGVAPAMGRNFTPDEDRVGGPPVVILTHGFWMRALGGEGDILGKSITLSGYSFSVIGVMPADFRFPYDMPDVDLYVPVEQFAENWIDNLGNHPGLMALARLRDGVTLEAARDDMERVAREIESEHFDTNEGSRVNLAKLQDRVSRNAREPLGLLLLSVGLLLIIACINVANLVLARATSRMPEMAVRTSMGASRTRILRLLLMDSLVLWLAGGFLGILLAHSGVRWVATLMADEIPWIIDVGLDLRVILVALAVSFLTGLTFGLGPALRVSRQDPKKFLKEGSRTTGAPGRGGFRRGLVVSEVSLAVAILVGAGLTLRSFLAMAETNPGLDPDRVLTAEINLPDTRYPGATERAAFFTRLLDRTRTLPGVVSAATSYVVPLGAGGWQNAYHPEGAPPEEGGQLTFAEVSSVSGDYFRTLGIPLIRGREFSLDDDEDAPPVAIVDQALAEEYWPGQDPIGKRIKWGDFESDNPWMEVVGVAGHVAVNGVMEDAWHQIYIPHWQDNDDAYWLMVKTRSDPLEMVDVLRREVLSLDPSLPLGRVRTMQAWVHETTRGARLTALLMGIFSVAAVLLAAVGVYGVMAQTTAERRHEIGIRVALGARGDQVMVMVLRQGLVTVGTGVVLGLVLAAALSRVVEAQLYQISASDPLTFIAAPLLVGLVALAANLLPARRATKVDPVRALQAE